MKHRLFLLLSLLVSTFAAAVAQDARPVQIVFIGNSITQGARLAAPLTEGPAPQTRDWLTARGHNVEILNQGLSGTTTFDWLPADSTRCFGPLIAATDAFFKAGATHIFSMMLGTNDSAETTCNGAPVAPERYAANMRAIIDTLLTRYPDAEVIVNYPIWYSPTTYNGAKYLQSGLDRLQSYHPVITALVGSYKERVHAGKQGAFAAFAEKPALFDEENGHAGKFYLHPNAEGARLLATFWAEAVEELLRR